MVGLTPESVANAANGEVVVDDDGNDNELKGVLDEVPLWSALVTDVPSSDLVSWLQCLSYRALKDDLHIQCPVKEEEGCIRALPCGHD